MPIRDVTVTIDLQRPAGLIGFGKPLILGAHSIARPYKEYMTLENLAVDYPTSTEVYKAAKALKDQTNSPETFAVVSYDSEEGSAVETLKEVWEKDWYLLLTTEMELTEIRAIADEVEAKNFKLFATKVNADSDLTILKAQNYDRTFAIYHSDFEEFEKHPDSAWVGERGSLPVGSVTWKFAELKGIQADELTSNDVLNINNTGGNVYVNRGGQPRTGEGIVVSGEYIDVFMAKDWIQANIENSIQTLLNNSPKIPYTNSGIAQLEAATINILRQAYNQGIIAEDGDGLPLYSTDFPTREQVPAEDRANRIYTGASFTFELAGAIHETKIHGTIVI